jgi:hypothetical protein
MMQAVARTDRKVIRQSRITAANTPIRIGNCADFTASLVAAITPTLPVASRNLRFSVSCRDRKLFTSVTILSIVWALWSAVKISTGITLQSLLSRPVEVSM